MLVEERAQPLEVAVDVHAPMRQQYLVPRHVSARLRRQPAVRVQCAVAQRQRVDVGVAPQLALRRGERPRGRGLSAGQWRAVKGGTPPGQRAHNSPQLALWTGAGRHLEWNRGGKYGAAGLQQGRQWHVCWRRRATACAVKGENRGAVGQYCALGK